MIKKVLLLLAFVLTPALACAQQQFNVAYLADPLPPILQLTTQTASIANTTMYTTPAVAGWYRICMSEEITRAATTSSALPAMNYVYTSGVDAINKFSPIAPGAALGGNATSASVGACSAPFYAAASTVIQYDALNYASSGATTMQYDISIKLETQ